MTRIERIRSTAGVSLARKPATLAARADRRFAGCARAVRISTRHSGRSVPAGRRRSARPAPGRSMSRIATSDASAARRAGSGRRGRPGRRPPCPPRRSRTATRVSRRIAVSSASRIEIIRAAPGSGSLAATPRTYGHHGRQGELPVLDPGRQRASATSCSRVGHVDQPPAGLTAGHLTMPSLDTTNTLESAVLGEPDSAVAGATVPQHVGHRLAKHGRQRVDVAGGRIDDDLRAYASGLETVLGRSPPRCRT